MAQPGGEWSLVFSDDDVLRQLNAEYRDHDETTDVLSFAMEDEDLGGELIAPPAAPSTAEGGPERLLGDVVISVEQAQRQTPDDLESELLRLMVHGFAHLLGHDHQRADQRATMRAAEARVLEHFGIEGLIERSH